MKIPKKESLLPRIVCTLVAAGLLSITPLASAEERSPFCEGDACFPETVSPLGMTLQKVSSARYRYYGFLVFDSSLYTESKDVLKGDFLGKKASALRLCYHRTLTAEEFGRSGRETLALNPNVKIDELEERIRQLHAKYRQVQAGDCYQLSFKPGTGTELSFNGTPEIVIPGDDFAAPYLGIWLSPYSFSESLAKKLTTPS